MNNDLPHANKQPTPCILSRRMLPFGLICLALSSSFLGCATMENDRTTTNTQLPSIDYAKKKSDWPRSFEEEIPEIPTSQEMTPEEHRQQGDLFLQQGDTIMALSHYEKALAANPDFFEVRVKIGNLFLQSRKPHKAKAYFIHVLDDHADYAQAHEGLGQAYFQLEEFEKAELHLWRAIDINPTLWKPHALLGIIYDLRGDHPEAITEHGLAIEHHAELGELYNNLGVSYSLAGNHTEASKAFQQALRKGASQDQIYNNLGLSLTRLGNYQGALDVLHFEGHEAQAFNNLGVLMLKDGYPQQAIACFEQALETQPTFYPKANTNLKRARSVLRKQVQEGMVQLGEPPSPCHPLS